LSVTDVTPGAAARLSLQFQKEKAMDPIELFRQVGIFALLTLVIAVVPVVAAGAYVLRPSEGRLALLRPFSLASLFSAAAGTLSGLVNVLQSIAATDDMTGQWSRVSGGASEALIPAVFGMTCLAVAWLLVAVGMRRGVRE
jgi:hypothetical protein